MQRKFFALLVLVGLGFSIGGMASKLKAVGYATNCGVQVTIANGRKPEQLSDLVAGKGRGTRFL